MAWAWRLLAADFVISLMWVWSSALNKVFVHRILGYAAHQFEGEIIRYGVSILIMFFFAFLDKATKGGTYNPLFILASAISGDFANFLFTVGARIPAQVAGSIYGVKIILNTMPGIGGYGGPRLNVDIAKGALAEGLLTFAISIIYIGLSNKASNTFFIKTWISSTSKLTLHILGSNLTGGCMNPAPVMGWAFANGVHISKEHLIVYWLAPVGATLMAAWVFRLISQPEKDVPRDAKQSDDAPKLKSSKLH